MGADGNLYGTTYGDGAANAGTVFQLTLSPIPALTTLHIFTGQGGANPQGTLLRDPDGILYGTTAAGGTGAANFGTVFKLTLTPTPSLTTLHEFAGTDGAAPQAGLLRGSDGNLYGTTFGSCTYGDATCTSGYGTVFTLAKDGSGFTTLPAFSGADGANLQTSLIQDSDGSFYGTTLRGGSTTGGVIFRLRVGNALTLTLDPSGTGTGTVTSAPTGITCPNICTEVFLPTATVTLTPAADPSSTFTGWSGDCTGTGTCAVALSAPRGVTATFTMKTFALTIQRTGTGVGTITSTPSGITCGSTCSQAFNYNTLVTLTATATSPSVFTGWSGADCSGTGTCVVTMTDLRTVTATFAPPTVSLTVAVGGSGGGTVTNTPLGITCTTTCPVEVASGSAVTLTVTAGAGGTFKGWRGDCTGTGTCVVTMSAPRSVTAVFTKTFTDSTLTVGSTPIKAVHITELRGAIDTLRSHYPGLGAFGWTDPTLTPGGTPIKRQHLLDLRTALDQSYTAAGKTHLPYADATITAGTTPIKASHLTELRGFVGGLE
jgi:uncharacterized repeat protein (TIGR03803 family)